MTFATRVSVDASPHLSVSLHCRSSSATDAHRPSPFSTVFEEILHSTTPPLASMITRSHFQSLPPDILANVVSFLDPVGETCCSCGHPDDRRALLSLTVACKALSSPALDRLWEQIPNLAPLVCAMPADLWTLEDLPSTSRRSERPEKHVLVSLSLKLFRYTHPFGFTPTEIRPSTSPHRLCALHTPFFASKTSIKRPERILPPREADQDTSGSGFDVGILPPCRPPASSHQRLVPRP